MPQPYRPIRTLIQLMGWCIAAATVHADGLDGGILKLVASNYPLAYFAERLAGTRAIVALPIPAETDPAYWRPDASAIGQMQKADLILLNGADYEKWLPQVSLPRLKVVDTSAGFRDAYVRIEQAVVHSHGTGGIHSHEGIASTTWLDFEQASKQAQAVAEALIRKRPEWKTLVAENLEALGADLAELDKKARDIVHAKPDQPLLASHPVYQYLEQRYGLHLQSMHWEPTVMPVATEWTGLTKIRMKHPARWMLWEAVPTPEIAKRLKAMGIGSLEFSPCAQRPASGDFLSEMQRNLENLRTAFH